MPYRPHPAQEPELAKTASRLDTLAAAGVSDSQESAYIIEASRQTMQRSCNA
jgi:hypothetical protein